MPASKDTGVLFIRNVKKTLRNQFKTQTVRRGTNMTDAIRKFMVAYVKSEGTIMHKIEGRHK